MSLQENRSDRRMPCMLPVRVEGATEGRHFDLMDASAGGMRLRSSSAMTVGRRFGVTILLPTGEAVKGLAGVKWSRRDGMSEYDNGLQFIDMTETSKRRLVKHLFPGRLGMTETFDLLLQFSACLMLVLVINQVLVSHPALMETFLDYMPFAIVIGGLSVCIGALIYSRLD